MIEFKTGNILDANTQAYVNTVNCEGYMGKGIAYQFKLKFPENNEAYIKACRNGDLKIGQVFPYEEDNKLIINFPTKDRWREKSNYSYIQKGLDSLVDYINNTDIESIAIPPLGCGNGGLSWINVRKIILEDLKKVDNNKINIIIYEPSNFINRGFNSIKKPPKLNASHLLLMSIKLDLKKFNRIRLQKAAYLINYLSNQEYFKFEAHNYGPYAHSIDILSKHLTEYQKYYNLDTEEAYSTAKNVLISNNVTKKETLYSEYRKKATEIVNNIEKDKNLELITTILYIIEKQPKISKEEIIKAFHDWSDYKASFSDKTISTGIKKLLELGLIQDSLYGFAPKRSVKS